MKQKWTTLIILVIVYSVVVFNNSMQLIDRLFGGSALIITAFLLSMIGVIWYLWLNNTK